MRYECLNLSKNQLKRRGIVLSNEEEPCSVCGLYTEYKDTYSNSAICSEECSVEWDRILAEAFRKESLC